MTEWQSSIIQSPLARNEVHIWRVNLEELDKDWHTLSSILSTDEQARANSYRFEHLKHRYIMGRSALRKLLGRYLNCSPISIRFSYNDYGKPSLSDNNSDIQFNVSRSQNIMLCAFVLNSEVGIDIEAINPNIDFAAISQSFFSEQERKALHEIDKNAIDRAFFRIWSRKEAYIKALGKGLSYPLQQFSVSLENNSAGIIEYQDLINEDKCWQIYDIEIENDYSAALVIQASKWQLNYYNYNI